MIVSLRGETPAICYLHPFLGDFTFSFGCLESLRTHHSQDLQTTFFRPQPPSLSLLSRSVDLEHPPGEHQITFSKSQIRSSPAPIPQVKDLRRSSSGSGVFD